MEDGREMDAAVCLSEYMDCRVLWTKWEWERINSDGYTLRIIGIIPELIIHFNSFLAL